MTTPRSPSRLLPALGAATVIAFIAIAAGCQPEPGEKPDPGAKPAGEGSRGPGATPGLAQREGIPESGVELGWGWNTRTGDVVPNRCVEFAPVQATGQRVNLSMREVSDKSDVMDSLGVSASVKVNAIFGASGSAHASFARESRVSSTSTSLLLRATIDNGVLFAGPRQDPTKARRAFPAIAEDGQPVPPSLVWKQWQEAPAEVARDEVVLTAWASELLRKSGQRAFVRHCGDAFVTAIYSGAELLAVTSFSATDKAQKEAVTAALKAQYGVVSVSAEAKKTNESTLSKTSMDVSYMQVGGGSGILPTTREALVKKLEELAAEAAQSPKFHSMEVTPYEMLASWPAGAIPDDDPAAEDTISDYYWSLTSLYDDIQSVLDNPAGYVAGAGLSLDELRALQDRVNALRADLYKVARYGRFGPPVSTFSFKSDQLATALTAPGQAPFTAGWVRDSFVPRLKENAPQGNVNLLRLNLPLPNGAKPENKDKITLGQAVVAHYVGSQSKRICLRDPSDSECLSNAELKALEARVPTTFKP